MNRIAVVCALLVACSPSVSESRREPVAVELPSAREIASTSAPDRAPRGKGAFLSGLAFKSAKVENAHVGAQTVRMAAEIDRATGSDKCPSVADLVAGKKLDPNRTDDPWGNRYRVVCEGDDVHAVSVGRDGIEGTADDIRDDATASDLERISEL